MGPLDALWHLLNFFFPALLTGLLAAGITKLLWRRELTSVSWRRLFVWAALGGAAALVGGLIMFGRDGKMATYGGMVLANALTLWWAAFGPMRR